VLTLVRLLTSVSSDVDGQRAALDEALATSRRDTGVGSLIRMYAVVSLKVRLAVEALLPRVSNRVCRRTQGDDKVGGNQVADEVCVSLTLLHDCQSHWKGRAVGSFSTSSINSISEVVLGFGGVVDFLSRFRVTRRYVLRVGLLISPYERGLRAVG
jgi:hypothetical protein